MKLMISIEIILCVAAECFLLFWHDWENDQSSVDIVNKTKLIFSFKFYNEVYCMNKMFLCVSIFLGEEVLLIWAYTAEM